jgi:hypothetical protein
LITDMQDWTRVTQPSISEGKISRPFREIFTSKPLSRSSRRAGGLIPLLVAALLPFVPLLFALIPPKQILLLAKKPVRSPSACARCPARAGRGERLAALPIAKSARLVPGAWYTGRATSSFSSSSWSW